MVLAISRKQLSQEQAMQEIARYCLDGETVSCNHVRQGDYQITRLFMCHDCIALIKANYIASASPGDNDHG